MYVMEDAERDGCWSSMDRISQLPQHILHHILYFLSQKEAVQTSVLSKAWRHTWSTRPNIEFRRHWFKKAPQEFFPTLNKTLQVYRDQELCIQEFVVGLRTITGVPNSILLLEKWIPKTIHMQRMKKFHFHANFHDFQCDMYDMLPLLFEAKSLQDLNLRYCRLGRTPSGEILFKQLKRLRLFCVHVDDEIFTKIIWSCPLIEDMGLTSCLGLRNIKVNNLHNLKEFTFINVSPQSQRLLKDISISMDDVLNLDKLYIRHVDDTANLLHSLQKLPNLKHLALDNVQLSSESFEYFSLKYLRSLKKLHIADCYGFDEFHLMSHTIENLYLKLVEKERIVKAVIDVPELVLFEYVGHGNYLPYPLSFTRTSSKWKSSLLLGFWNSISDVSSWFFHFHEVLKALSQSKIYVRISPRGRNYPLSYERALLVEDNGLYKPVRVECLDIRNDASFCSALLDRFLCICRPMRIVYKSNAGTERERKWDFDEVTEFLCKIQKEREKQQCWVKDLVEVNMEDIDQQDPLHVRNPLEISFQLTWRRACFHL